MAVAGGPNIVEDGLVFYIDAANPQSYPGSGTTWYDLSGNGNDGILANGPIFNQEIISSVSLDGIDDYLTLPNIDTYSSTAKFTIEGTVRAIGGNWGRIYTNGSIGTPNGVSGFINTDLIILTNSSRPYLFFRVGNSTIVSTQISTNTWSGDDFIMYFVFSVNKENRTGFYFFRFGQNTGLLQEELSGTFTPGTATGFVENRLGAETDNESYAKMDVYTFKIYNKVLSVKEIQQNYNALKSRFDL